jgi:hypothetical protein
MGGKTVLSRSATRDMSRGAPCGMTPWVPAPRALPRSKPAAAARACVLLRAWRRSGDGSGERGGIPWIVGSDNAATRGKACGLPPIAVTPTRRPVHSDGQRPERTSRPIYHCAVVICDRWEEGVIVRRPAKNENQATRASPERRARPRFLAHRRPSGVSTVARFFFTLEDAMPARSRLLVAGLISIGVAACGRRTTVADESLRRDLNLASGQGIQLAPNSSAGATLSADELLPAGSRVKSTAPAMHQQAKPSAAHAATKVAQAPVPSVQHDTVVATPTQRPSAVRAISPPPPGGYKTMGELIRKAPFPINP